MIEDLLGPVSNVAPLGQHAATGEKSQERLLWLSFSKGEMRAVVRLNEP